MIAQSFPPARRNKTVIRLLPLLLMSLLLTGCEDGVFARKGTIGDQDAAILIDSLIIMLTIVVPTICATFAFAWWYRASNTRAAYNPDFVYSGRIELIVWSIPLLTITLLGGVAWIGSHQLDPGNPLPGNAPTLEIQGVSLDWKWLFIYPDQHVASVDELVVPVGARLHFSLTSASVLNVFFVPALGSMIYTMNGMATELNLDARQAGTYRGQSYHFSGDGFPNMLFQVRAVPPADFTAWVAATRGAGAPRLERASYTELEKQGVPPHPFVYSDIAPNMFADIVSQKLPPGPGPVADASGMGKSPAGQGAP